MKWGMVFHHFAQKIILIKKKKKAMPKVQKMAVVMSSIVESDYIHPILIISPDYVKSL